MSNSLGYLPEYRINRNAPKIVTKESPLNTSNVVKNQYFWKVIKLTLSLATMGLVFSLGIVYLPGDKIINFDEYDKSLDLFRAMGKWFSNNPLFLISTWLVPIPFAVFIPLWVTEIPLAIAAIIMTLIMFLSLCFYQEGKMFIDMLETTPESVYMWYDYITIIVCTFLVQPYSFLLIFSGPITCITMGDYTTKTPFYLFIIVGITSIVFILPVSYIYINDDDEFFLLGYTTKSIFGNILQSGMIIVWVRFYHLVGRDCHNTFKSYKSNYYRLLGIIWAVIGTALVEIWVSSSWALHLAYASFMKLEKEKELFEIEYFKRIVNNVKTFLR